MPKRITAAQQFTDLGIPESDWTPAMRLAVKQRWSLLPVSEKVDVLRQGIAAVEPDPTPTVDQLATTGHPREECEKEARRLKRNAGVNAWRDRGQLQAALDARTLKFAQLRAAKKAPAAAVGDAS